MCEFILRCLFRLCVCWVYDLFGVILGCFFFLFWFVFRFAVFTLCLFFTYYCCFQLIIGRNGLFSSCGIIVWMNVFALLLGNFDLLPVDFLSFGKFC